MMSERVCAGDWAQVTADFTGALGPTPSTLRSPHLQFLANLSLR